MANLKKVFGEVLNQFKNQFIPTKDDTLRLTWGGAIAVPDKKNEGFYIAFDKDGKIRRYPKSMTLKVPVMFLNKQINQVKPGDVVKHNGSYFNVIKVKEGKLVTRSYTGFIHSVLPIEDFLIGKSTIQVAINLYGVFGDGASNPTTLFGNFGNTGNGLVAAMISTAFLSDKDSENEGVDDEFTEMSRRELKLYQQHNNLDIRVVPSMSDETLRNKIREKLGRKTSDEDDSKSLNMLLMSQMLGAGNNAISPLAMAMLANNGDDDMMSLLMMNQMGLLTPPAQDPAPAEAPQEVEIPDTAEDTEAAN